MSTTNECFVVPQITLVWSPLWSRLFLWWAEFSGFGSAPFVAVELRVVNTRKLFAGQPSGHGCHWVCASYRVPINMEKLPLGRVGLWQMHPSKTWTPPLTAFFTPLENTGNMGKFCFACCIAPSQDFRSRSFPLPRNPNYWNCEIFAKIAAALQLTM